MMKEVEKFQRVFISPDLTWKQQERDTRIEEKLKSLQLQGKQMLELRMER
jgi:hypothetical protein